MSAPRISLIHATPLAIAPISDAFDRLWPGATRMNVLDDSLSPDLVMAGRIDDLLTNRFGALVRYATQSGADGVLFTCSAFGPAIDVASTHAGVPVFKPNEAMFKEALDLCAGLGRAGRIGMVSTFSASVASMRDELTAIAKSRGIEFTLQVECPAGALEALGQGRVHEHDALVSEAAGQLLANDVLMLGQFSMSHMRDRVAAETGLPVLSSPDSAVRLLKKSIEAERDSFPCPPKTDWRYP